MDEQTNLELCHVRLQEDFKTLKEARQGRCDLEKPLSDYKLTFQEFMGAMGGHLRASSGMHHTQEGHSHD
ncbi:hypothetical protein [Celeribacter baekdonensis]|uniref:hypothetical protein n=1 Tax=Celeribacter baekdonensis TaxID=875171 RepID=UPI0030DD124A|tara:strand:+ start:180387 stop:180596 length:210 start_codon:yes stop_codon:yes gene_type:complete